MLPLTGLVPLPYRILAIVLLIISVFGAGYVKGYGHASDKYEAREAKFIVESEKKYNELLIKKNKVDIQVVTEYLEKKVYITKWRGNNAGLINKIPESTVCSLPNSWVLIHDSSSKGLHADAAKASDGTASGFTTSDALGTVVDNYATCHETAEQLKSLQKWINEQQKIVKETNKK